MALRFEQGTVYNLWHTWGEKQHVEPSRTSSTKISTPQKRDPSRLTYLLYTA